MYKMWYKKPEREHFTAERMRKMDTNIYVIRHGETDSNIRSACLGRKDVPLNDTGRKQASELAARLSPITFSRIYTSPLVRTVSTAAPLGGMTVDERLIERDYGSWDDMTFDEIKRAAPEEFIRWQENLMLTAPPGGESSFAVWRRVSEFLQELLKSGVGGNIAIVTHLGTARHIIAYLLGLMLEQSWLFTLENGRYAKITVSEDKAVLSALNL